jgi:23S rRNA (adenine2503-C2)-methyltransferase
MARRASICDLTFSTLCAALDEVEICAEQAKALWRTLYRDRKPVSGRVQPLSDATIAWARRTFGARALADPAHLNVTDDVTSSDRMTRKCVLKLVDGHLIETVLMSFRGRFTACLSTQVGCAMSCVFCATGQRGFGRHLAPGEIVAQVLLGNRLLRAAGQAGIRNVVLMGMGEPLHNYASVMSALEILTDRRGLNIGPRRVTISTVGIAPAILRLAEEARPYNLAVSLHAASNDERTELVPATKRWPLHELMAACRAYTAQTRRKIFFEWTLIEGKNDSEEHAQRLAALIEGVDGHVNLIPLNPTARFDGLAPAHSGAIAFQQVLRERGIPSTVRQRRGIEMAAGCGQLAAARSANDD